MMLCFDLAAGHLKIPLAELMPDKASLFRPLYFRSAMLQPVACVLRLPIDGWVGSIDFARQAQNGLRI